LIISRAPFRLSLGGGGTDLPSYYTKHGGFFVSGAVDKHVYIAVNKRFEDGLRISYSTTELVPNADAVKHPLVREGLRLMGIEKGVEIVSIADAPAETGLGSSGSFCVGLLKALYSYKRQSVDAQELAEEACDLAMNRLKEPSGKQDEYTASFGDIRSYEIDTAGKVTAQRLELSTNTLSELEASILMYYTGLKRSASQVLTTQQEAIKMKDGAERMHAIKEIGIKSRDALVSGDLTKFGELLHEHWLSKRLITNTMSTESIDRWYKLARENGAIGGKLVGAGGGGFLMLFCEHGRDRLRRAMAHEGIVEHRFHFDFQGAKTIYDL
jgi:D-glycero-alpha-D-manno-heptose-7-phosphate kinase